MKMLVLVILLVSVLVILPGCGSDKSVGIEAKASFEPSVKSEVNWVMYPGGGIESLHSSSSYCINLKISKKIGKSISSKGLVAYVTAGSDYVLKIFVASESGDIFKSGDDAEICLDLDGYGIYLGKTMTKRTKPLKIYLDLEDKIYEAELPESSEIFAKENREIDIDLHEGGALPDEKVLKPVKAGDWPNIRDVMGPPALARKQDGLCAIYFFYTNR